MYTLVCRESGLDCDFVIKGETFEEFIENGANHAIQKHDMRVEDIYLNDIPVPLHNYPVWSFLSRVFGAQIPHHVDKILKLRKNVLFPFP